MNRSNQHPPLTVQHVETNQWPFPMHTQNQFELILIQAGSGHHSINGNRFPYQANDVFLLGPLDSNHFVVDKKTQFDVLSFTELYLAELAGIGVPSWQQIRDYSRRKSQSLVGSIITDRAEQKNLNALVAIIIGEQNTHAQLVSNPVVDSLMRTILSLLDRQLAQYQAQPTAAQLAPFTFIQRIVTYVCQHIAEPNYLRIDNLADVFNYSQSHLRALFKQQTGESIQQYIIRYRLQLVETKLGLSTMSISQIADELGFTDVCHLNKLFKRYYLRTPTDYRREKSSAISTNFHSRQTLVN